MSFFGDGLVDYLRKNTNNEINEKVQTLSNRNSCEPSNIVLYEDNSEYLCNNESRTNNYLCFEFKNDRVIQAGYKLMPFPFCENDDWMIMKSGKLLIFKANALT